MYGLKRFVQFFIVILAIAAAAVAIHLPVAAQGGTHWAPESRIPGYDDNAEPPYMIADQNHTIHLFNSVWIEGQRLVVYSRWSLAQGWTQPIDVLLPVLKSETRVKGAYLDRQGSVHLIFFSGDQTEANIYYTHAPLLDAASTRAWSAPVVIGEAALDFPDEAALVADSNGRMYFVYSSQLDARGLFFRYSDDNGATWSVPAPIFLTYSNELWPFTLSLYVDSQNRVHGVWTVANIRGNADALYHAKLEPGQTVWDEPTELNPPDEVGSGTLSAIIEYEQEMIIIYHRGVPLSRHMIRSSDWGQSWTQPVRLFPHEGSNGEASLVVDSSNTLHMFFGNRVTDGNRKINFGMWHSVWRGGHWSAPEALVSGPQRDDFDPSYARAIVSQGNLLLVTWMSDPGLRVRGSFYSYKVLDAPEFPLAPLPTLPPTATPLPHATATPVTPTPTPTPIFAFDPSLSARQPVQSSGAATPLIVAVVPSVTFVAVVVVLSRWRMRPRKSERRTIQR
jgi:hypothetical protein